MSQTPDTTDWRLIAAIQDGLPLVPRPYVAIAAGLGLTEAEVCRRIRRMDDAGLIKRFGVVVRHRELGYRANAMVVWDIDERRVDTAGRWLAGQPGITLCYRRPRRPPDWPYNLFCMVHGRDRGDVGNLIEGLASQPPLAGCPHEILFSLRRFSSAARNTPSQPGRPVHGCHRPPDRGSIAVGFSDHATALRRRRGGTGPDRGRAHRSH
ncbi:MAG: AsnC family transcriptional regulator [Gammaproteobacteria bacterium]|nr:AsnC family transcriptional regulator [Gammaproteobacteria bacterium]